MKKKFLTPFFIAGGVLALAVAFLWPAAPAADSGSPRSYEDIIRSGVLRATTEYNSIGYFVEDDTLTGFHYELLRAFARAKGLKADIKPEMELETQMEGINHGTFDLIAGSLLITSEQKDSLLLFTVPILRNKQVLVQRKPQSEDDSLYIRTQLDLGGKTVYVPEGSPVQYRIRNLAMEIADTIRIEEVPKYGSEQLLALVAHGDIDYAICEESIARKLIGQFPQLDIDTAISFNQFYGWGVSKESQALRDTLNTWLKGFMRTKAFQRLVKRYVAD